MVKSIKIKCLLKGMSIIYSLIVWSPPSRSSAEGIRKSILLNRLLWIEEQELQESSPTFNSKWARFLLTKTSKGSYFKG